MFEISPVQYLAPSVDMTLFQCVLIVSIDAVCVVTSPKYSRRSPPAVILVLLGKSCADTIRARYTKYDFSVKANLIKGEDYSEPHKGRGLFLHESR